MWRLHLNRLCKCLSNLNYLNKNPGIQKYQHNIANMINNCCVRETVTAHPQPKDTLQTWRGESTRHIREDVSLSWKEGGWAEHGHLKGAWLERVECSIYHLPVSLLQLRREGPHASMSTLKRRNWMLCLKSCLLKCDDGFLFFNWLYNSF